MFEAFGAKKLTRTVRKSGEQEIAACRLSQQIRGDLTVCVTFEMIGAPGRNRTGTTQGSRDFKSLVSTYSTTGAFGEVLRAGIV